MESGRPVHRNEMRQLFFFLFTLFCAAQSTAKPLPALIPYRDGDKWGYCDTTGVVKITPQWDEADFFCGKKAVVTIYPNAPLKTWPVFCLIDDKGNYIIPPSRHWNRAWVGWQKTLLNAHDSNGRYGLIDTNNNVLIPFEYEQETRYPVILTDGYKIVFKSGKAGLINGKNETLIPFIYDHIDECPSVPGQPVFKVTLKGYFGLVDVQGRELIAARYSGIYPASAFGYTNHAPTGFTIVRTVLKNKKDSSKGSKDLYGWADYSTRELIEPKYNYFSYLSDSFYVADGRLYNRAHKLALPVTYNSFSRRNDTIFANGPYRPKGQKFTTHDEYAFDAGDLQPLGKKTVTEKNFNFGDYFPPRPWICGTGMQAMQDFEHQEAMRPTVIIGGNAVKDFIRDTVHWYTDYLIGENRVVLHGWGTTQYTGWQAVVNRKGEFIFPPFRSQQGEITALNIKDSLIILRAFDAKDGVHYGLCNLAGQMLISFQAKILSMPFRGPSGQIFMVAGVPSPPPAYSPFQHINFGNGQVLPGYTCQLCDTSLNPLPSLQNFYVRELIDKQLEPSDNYQGYIKGTDSGQRWGFVNLDGDTLFKKISFKYKYLYNLGPYLFMIQDYKNNTMVIRLVNRKNEEVLGNVHIKYLNRLANERTNHTELFYPKDLNEYRLVRVWYKTNETMPDRDIYVSEKGQIFAGKL